MMKCLMDIISISRIAVLLGMSTLGYSIPTMVQDYCQNEVFRAKCWEKEAILMLNATYGRMRVGKCVSIDMGFLTCAEDVTRITDRMCSGKNECQFSIPNTELDATKPCLTELRPYLEASYTCVRIATPDRIPGSSHHGRVLTHPTMHLSSLVADENKTGSPGAPWILDAMAGQKINLTLLDFTSSPTPSFGLTKSTNILGYIYERELDLNTTIMGSDLRRTRGIYTSTSHKVEVVLLPEVNRRRKGRFLVKYEAYGCADLIKPQHAWYKRKGNMASIGCHNTEKIWHLQCVGDKWIGVVGNCSFKAIEPMPVKSKSVLGSLPYGFTIAVIIGLAVGLSALVLICGLVCLAHRKKYLRRRDPSGAIKDSRRPQSQQTNARKKYSYQSATLPPTPDEEAMSTKQKHATFAHAWNTGHPDPRLISGSTDSDYGSQSYYSSTPRNTSRSKTKLLRETNTPDSLSESPYEMTYDGHRYFMIDKQPEILIQK